MVGVNRRRVLPRPSARPVAAATLSAVAVAAALLTPASSASTGTTPEPCASSEAVPARIAVTHVDVHRVEDDSLPYSIETIATATVVEVPEGGLPTTVRIWAPGGVISPTEYLVTPDQFYPVAGSDGLVCLTPDRAGGLSGREGAPFHFVEPPADAALAPPSATDILALPGDSATEADPGWTSNGTGAPYRDLPFRYYVNPNTADMTGEEWEVTGGSAAWDLDPHSWVTFAYMGTTTRRLADDGLRVVSWTFPPTGTCQSFVGRLWWQPGNSQWDIEFNDYCTWGNAFETPWGVSDVGFVAMHEFGHGLGLDHTTKKHQVMCENPTGCGDYFFRHLGDGDLAGLRHLYPYRDYQATTDTPVANMDVGTPSPGNTSGTRELTLRFANTGRTPWGPFHQVHLRYIDGGCSRFSHRSWIDCDDVAATGFVERRQTASLDATTEVKVMFQAPLEMLPGYYTERYQLEAIGHGRFGPVITVTFFKTLGSTTIMVDTPFDT